MKVSHKKENINVLICDDSAFFRVTLRKIIEKESHLKVIDIARNGEEAIEKAIRLKPDVITMDLHMPVLDGLSALKDIVRLKIAPVIILAATNTEDAQATMDAIEAGAFDFISKPDEVRNLGEYAENIIQKIKEAAISDIYGKIHENQQTNKEIHTPNVTKKYQSIINHSEIGYMAVALGLSTGGPRSIYKVLPLLPPDLNAAVFVIQHMPTTFINIFAQRLNQKTAMECRVSEAGLKIEPQKIYVAAGGYHLKLSKNTNRDIRIRHTKEPVHLFMPSVDVAMHSICDVFKDKTIGVLMTGMGRDGAEAMTRINQTGGITIAESESTAIVFGMPQEAIKLGGVQRVVPNWGIANAIIHAVQKEGLKYNTNKVNNLGPINN